MPLVRKKHSPFWYYDFRYGGRRYRESTEKTVKAQAALVEAEALAALQRGDYKARAGKKPPLLRAFLPEYLDAIEANQLLSLATKRYYQNGVRLIRNTPLVDIPIDLITKTIVAAAEFPGSGSNANNAVRTLRSALSYAAELCIIRSAPSLHLHRERERDQTYSPQQEADLLVVADQDTKDGLILLFDSGMRPEEACRLEVEWILWDHNTIRIVGGKTRAATREIPMTTRVREMLTARLKRLQASRFASHRLGKFVFPAKKMGTHISIKTFRDGFNKAKAATNLPADLVLYSTRHTFGTDMAELGNPKLTMRTMGHTQIKTSARYQHPETSRVAGFLDERNAKRKSLTNPSRGNGQTFGQTQPTIQ